MYHLNHVIRTIVPGVTQRAEYPKSVNVSLMTEEEKNRYHGVPDKTTQQNWEIRNAYQQLKVGDIVKHRNGIISWIRDYYISNSDLNAYESKITTGFMWLHDYIGWTHRNPEPHMRRWDIIDVTGNVINDDKR